MHLYLYMLYNYSYGHAQRLVETAMLAAIGGVAYTLATLLKLQFYLGFCCHAQRLVETAMLAAVGGVAYTLATLLKLQSYLGYLQPMPVVVAAMRWGPSAARKATTATTLLLLGAQLVPLG